MTIGMDEVVELANFDQEPFKEFQSKKIKIQAY